MNLRELFTKYPLGCESYNGEWVRRWEALGRLLKKRARLEVWSGRVWTQSKLFSQPARNVADALRQFALAKESIPHYQYRIVLLDGTIVKEWGAT